MGQVLWIIKNKIKALYLQGTYSLVGKTNLMYKQQYNVISSNLNCCCKALNSIL